VFLVQRQAMDDDGAFCNDSQSGNDTGSRVPLKLFPARAEAEAYRDELARRDCHTMNPFHLYAGVEPGPDEETLCGRLRELGLAHIPPASVWYLSEWRTWWDAQQDNLTDDQRAAVWNLFSVRPLYEVTEIELED
jgi:hypothetical protein